jgi:hypothetical protein
LVVVEYPAGDCCGANNGATGYTGFQSAAISRSGDNPGEQWQCEHPAGGYDRNRIGRRYNPAERPVGLVEHHAESFIIYADDEPIDG